MALPFATAGALAAVALLIAAVRAPWRRAALWFALAAVGQGASLSMIDAGPRSGYQHYPPFSSLAADHSVALGILAVQALAVALAWIGKLRSGGPTAGQWGRIAAAVALSVVTAATVSHDVRRYLSELAFAIVVQLTAIATIALIAFDAPLPKERADPADALDDETPDPRFPIDAQIWAAAGFAFVLTAVLSLTVYERHPHVPDEVVYLHHAKYLAAGQLTMPAPAVPRAFDVDLMEYEPERWYSPVPPGWPLALAVGARVGAPWLVNPLLAGVNVLLTFLLLAQVYSRPTARLGAMLLAVSPWFLFLGMSYMTHQLTLFCTLVAGVAVAAARRAHLWLWGLVAGIGVGAVSLVRPLDGVVVGLCVAAWALGVGGRRLRLAPLAALAVGTVIVGALVFPYNRMLTGDPLKFPINEWANKRYPVNANAYGFGPDRGMGWATDPNPGHSPIDGIINANLNTFAVNTELFGWATGSLILVTWLLVSGAWRRQDSMMLVGLLAFPIAHFPYYFSGGPDFGARYWFPAIVPLVALSARGMKSLAQSAGTGVWVAVGALIVMTVVTYVPWRATDKYHHYRGMRADIRALAAEHRFGADLILIEGRRSPDYASAFALNPVDLRSEAPIYAWDRDAATRAAVLSEYAGRRVWLVNGPSVTGRGFEVESGPVLAADLLRSSK
jgi:hypothetical protein